MTGLQVAIRGYVFWVNGWAVGAERLGGRQYVIYRIGRRLHFHRN